MALNCSQSDRQNRKPKLCVVSSKFDSDQLHELDLIANQNGISRSACIRLLVFNSLPKQNSQDAA